MDRDYIMYKCSACGFESQQSYYASGGYGDWRCGVDLQATNAEREKKIQSKPCPACKTGNFNRKSWMYDSNSEEANMGPDDFLELIKNKEEWNSWREKNIGINPNLSNRDLRPYDFKGRNLAYVHMEQANLSGMDLREEFDFKKYNAAETPTIWLNGANLEGANLEGAYFCRPEIKNANFKNADLRNAVFINAFLQNTDFSGSDLRGTTLKKSFFDKAEFTNCKLHDTSFSSYFYGWRKNRTISDVEDSICDYVMVGKNGDKRKPRSGKFQPGEFGRWIDIE